MRAFRDGGYDVLVSTAVVEVGVDVPNATVMLIEGAERFGLSQLHQFRGRVGRGEKPGTCLLLTDQAEAETWERLKLLEQTTNGFALAERDLAMRGPGDFFGVRQSGFPELKMANFRAVELVQRARASAARVLEVDPDLSRPEHQPLGARIERLLGRSTESG
jgi:ATP-dependent DNA helicase RecG